MLLKADKALNKLSFLFHLELYTNPRHFEPTFQTDWFRAIRKILNLIKCELNLN